ncbi:class I SAM-dependent methyltransferase [Actinokineospora soli]|uniref:Class I SAM-dependent methyltransferase n=1 Tax=Actinokineospora soli TaxID=1048753 RepID=A0ABW2TVK9_9PSEU
MAAPGMLSRVTENQVPAFDLIGKRYDESFVERDTQIAEVDWLIAQLPQGARVLDLGCGSGLPTARQLLDAGMVVVGVDESRVMLDLAEEQAPAATTASATSATCPAWASSTPPSPSSPC